VNVVKLKQKSIWEISLNANDSWGWKNMLELRDKIKEYVFYRVGNGKKILVWHDKWCEEGPLINIVSYRSIYDARLKPNATISEMIVDGNWIWPREWYDKYPVLRNVQCPTITQNLEDKVLWLTREGNLVPYSTKAVWKDLRGVWPIMKWHHVVWFSQFNPKHAFVMWMAIQGRLMTQYRIKVWKKDDELRCPLCKKVADSHKHLFYECVYSAKVWKEMRQFMKLDKDYESMVERNGRIFKSESRTEDELCCVIKENIKNKLMSLRVKRSSEVFEVCGYEVCLVPLVVVWLDSVWWVEIGPSNALSQGDKMEEGVCSLLSDANSSLPLDLFSEDVATEDFERLFDDATSFSSPSHYGCGLNGEGGWEAGNVVKSLWFLVLYGECNWKIKVLILKDTFGLSFRLVF
ncbi:RNA-directed DNA polymerase, eukaryota, reverse transcriptase zinc-binding domain protein, partial [Tanacetum coccineum]